MQYQSLKFLSLLFDCLWTLLSIITGSRKEFNLWQSFVAHQFLLYFCVKRIMNWKYCTSENNNLQETFKLLWEINILKEQCHRLRIPSAHKQTWKSWANFFKFENPIWRPYKARFMVVKEWIPAERKCLQVKKKRGAWGKAHKRLYLTANIFDTWSKAKIVAGYERSTDSDFAAHLLSLEMRRR